MKAFKLASGFAVSALTLAIAGAAVAESTASVDFTGSIRVQSVIDLEAETRASQMPGYETADEDWYQLNATWTVANGPFSGKIRVGINEDEKPGGAGWGPGVAVNDNDKNNGYVRVYDLKVEEGAVSFGQVGSIRDTVGKLEGLTDFRKSAETGLNDGFGVVAALRYTVEEFGVKVQSEGADSDDFGFAAAVHQDLDVAEVWADFSYREAQGGQSDGYTAFGLAVEAAPVDLIKVEAAFRQNGNIEDSAWAAKLTVNATDDISVFGQVASVSVENEEMAIRAGAKATFAPITVEGWYALDLNDEDDSGNVFAKVSYAEGAISAFAETEMGLSEGNGLQFKLGGKYTTESGVEYGAEYANGEWANENSEKSVFTAFAQYSF
ncbi:hypothetical protein NFC81_12445 [Salinispirillum sp. LH 10-3-1]|uniref:Porin n=1 Tax=Salinispirillum sp. LH 10-3-1 TaxID=2952525 RepID=A0AB38YDS2_9GAMM